MDQRLEAGMRDGGKAEQHGAPRTTATRALVARATLCAALLTMVGCLPLAAQRLSVHDASLELSYGIVGNPPRLFSSEICPDEHPSSLLVAGTLRIHTRFFVSLGVSQNSENPEECFTGAVPPIPDQGPYTSHARIVDADVAGYPFAAVHFLAGLQTGSERGSVRAGLGPVWYLGKGIVGTRAAAVGPSRSSMPPWRFSWVSMGRG